jgi:hypothetical protein
MPPLPLGGPPPEVMVSPEHMAAYAANCRRTLHYSVNGRATLPAPSALPGLTEPTGLPQAMHAGESS